MSAGKIRISAVKYANTYPFLYGLKEAGFEKKAVIETDHPAHCAEKLIYDKADIGLIPVAALPMLRESYIITDFCLGAYGKVKTVLMLCNCYINDIRTINLDYRSLSSISLARILAKFAWKREFRWNNTTEGFDFLNIPPHEAVVLIGDQCYEYEKFFNTRIDLAEEWNLFTGLPFAFACWTANKKIDVPFLEEFNDALAIGVNNIPAVVEMYGNTGIIKGEELGTYLTENIDFRLNEDKYKAINLFLEMLKKL
jgi:chorismate dehydratase